MDEDESISRVRAIVQALIHRLDDSAGLGLEVLEVAHLSLAEEGPDIGDLVLELNSGRSVREASPGTDALVFVRVKLGMTGREEVGYALFPLGVPDSQAVVEVANQIQDYIAEALWGDPVPSCPGHSHPLAASVLDGNPLWHCPRDPSHYSEAIVDPVA